jgi:hypothetical protein
MTQKTQVVRRRLSSFRTIETNLEMRSVAKWLVRAMVTAAERE